MSTHAYTQIPGHGLAGEGAAHDDQGRRINGHTGGTGRAKCSCGEMSDVLPSGYKRKAWHREHKATTRR